MLESYINNRNGTDGFRLRCHQFYTSSLPRLVNCISRCKTCSLTMKHMTSAPLWWWANGDQGQNTRNTAFPLNTGHWSFIVWWSRRNPCAPWQQRMVSRTKRSVVFFCIRISSVDSKKRNGTGTRLWQRRDDILAARALAHVRGRHLHLDLSLPLPCILSTRAGKDAAGPPCAAGLIGTQQA